MPAIELVEEPRALAPVEAIELTHRIRRIVVAEPPEPIRALAQSQLALGGRLLLALRRIGLHYTIEGQLRLAQEIPRPVLGGIAHPGGQCAVHPASRQHFPQRRRLEAARETV